MLPLPAPFRFLSDACCDQPAQRRKTMSCGFACLALALFIGTTARSGGADVETGVSSVNLAGVRSRHARRWPADPIGQRLMAI
jgi:hypothetical protein